MIGVGLRIKAYAYFFIGGAEKKKFFNEWFIEFFNHLLGILPSQPLP